MVRTIEVVPYAVKWPAEFRAAAEELASIWGEEVIAVRHVGSTAVPDLPAKPIIDVLVEVHDIERIDAYDPEMLRRGYQPKGEAGIPGRRFFVKGGDESRTHHVHVFPAGHERIARYLAFRDYLRTHPDEARAYGALKVELAHSFPHDIEGYMTGKDSLIQELEHRAQAWRKGLA
jgi:GrpB-like predicted nucleotidyltransferase (UPF0157 family)